jgi:hypothetical protein
MHRIVNCRRYFAIGIDTHCQALRFCRDDGDTLEKGIPIRDKDPNSEAYKIHFPARLLFSPTFGESIEGQLTQDGVSITGKGVIFLAHGEITQTSICSVGVKKHGLFHFTWEENKDLLAPDIFTCYRRWILRGYGKAPDGRRRSEEASP